MPNTEILLLMPNTEILLLMPHIEILRTLSPSSLDMARNGLKQRKVLKTFMADTPCIPKYPNTWLETEN